MADLSITRRQLEEYLRTYPVCIDRETIEDSPCGDTTAMAEFPEMVAADVECYAVEDRGELTPEGRLAYMLEAIGQNIAADARKEAASR